MNQKILEEAAGLARKNQFYLLALRAFGDLQRLVNIPQGREKDGRKARQHGKMDWYAHYL